MANNPVRELLGLQGDGSSSEEEHVAAIVSRTTGVRKRRRGSVLGHRMINRDRQMGHNRLHNDYFGNPPVYPHELFRRRFRMSQQIYLRIIDEIGAYDDFFKLKENAAGIPGCSSLQKVTAALRIIAYGGPADGIDEYVRMGKSTIIESLKRFTQVVVVVFGPSYLRAPNNQEVAQLLAKAEERGFPGILGSIDCMYWRWEKCPTAWQGMYTGHFQKRTLILEAVASHDLRIWHAYFGLPGSHNDVNVLHRSPVFDDLASGNASEVSFMVNGNQYNMGYYLADGIYPDWATLVKSIPLPQGRKKRFFAKMQAKFRKDVERAFGVLQSRWAIMHGPTRFWHPEDLNYIVYCVVILHNMIIEDERERDGPAGE